MQKILLGGADFMDGLLFIGSGGCKDRSIFGENGLVTLADLGGWRGWLPPLPYFFLALPSSATPVFPTALIYWTPH